METATDLEKRYVMQNYPRAALTFVRGEGCRLYDDAGNVYLDFLGGLAVVALGHSHAGVADAAAAQLRTLVHASNLYTTEPMAHLAAKLSELAGFPTRAFFSGCGATANEAAIKLARRWGQGIGGQAKYEIVAALDSFHGRTLATLAATGQPEKHAVFQPLPSGFQHVPFGDLRALEDIVDPDRTAAVMLECVQGEGGVQPAPPGYLPAVRDLCDATGVLLLLDEVQTGIGRTGKWFAFQHFGIEPDIFTLAKALANGLPIGACLATDEVAAAFRPGDHASTFGGNPVTCAAALATLAAIEQDGVLANVAAREAQIRTAAPRLPGVHGVRGLGLLLALELDAPRAPEVAKAALAEGLVVNAVRADALRLAPPLVVTEAEVTEALGVLETVLAEGTR